MIINHNLNAISTSRQLRTHQSNLTKNFERLSSGMRINSSKDDPAGLVVSEKMRSQIRGMTMARQNIQMGMTMLQTAEGWLNQSNEILQRLRELAIQTANGIYSKEDRQQIQIETEQLVKKVDRIASQAEFNRLKLFQQDSASTSETNETNTPKGGISIQFGPNMDDQTTIQIQPLSASGLGIAEGSGDAIKQVLDYTSAQSSNEAIGKIDKAFEILNRQRSILGANQMNMEMTLQTLDVAQENIIAAESYIRDTNVAQEMIQFIKNKLLQDASATLLSHANVQPYVVIRLLDI